MALGIVLSLSMVVRIRMTESFILCRSYRTLSLQYLQYERAGYGAGQGQQKKTDKERRRESAAG